MLKNHQQQAWTVFGKKAQRCHSLTMDTQKKCLGPVFLSTGKNSKKNQA